MELRLRNIPNSEKVEYICNNGKSYQFYAEE